MIPPATRFLPLRLPSGKPAAFLLPFVLVALAAAPLPAVTVDEALTLARPISSLTFTPERSSFLPGKGRGTPAESLGDLGIALIYSQNNHWTDPRWSAAGYDVRAGTLADRESRLPPVTAYEIAPPRRAAEFQFAASGNDLFFRFPSKDDYTVYRFLDNAVAEAARIPAADVSASGFTKVPGMNLHDLQQPAVYFYLKTSVKVADDTEVAPGVSVAAISHTPLGRIVRFSIDVAAAGVPENTRQGGRLPGDTYAARPGLTVLPDPRGGISATWQDQTTKRLMLTTVGDTLAVRTVALPGEFDRFSNVVRDDAGNLYYAAYEEKSAPRVFLFKTAPDGSQLLSLQQDTAGSALNIANMSPFWDSIRASLAGDRLCVVYMRGMDNGHQGSIIVTYRTDDLALVRNHGQNSSHSFDSRVVHDGSAFLNVSLGDNYPRGLVLHRIFPSSMPGKVVYTYKTRHYDSGAASNDNRTYTELGNLAPGPAGAGLLFASEAGTDNAAAVGAINEARNLGYLLVAPAFETMPQSEFIVPPGMILTHGADSPLFGFYDYGGRYVRQQYRGVRWLTSYTDRESENATRPKMVPLNGGNRLVLWEKWTPSRHLATCGLVIGEHGDIVHHAADLGPIRLSDGDDAAVLDGRVHTLAANGRTLDWFVIDPAPAPISIRRHRIDPRAGVVEIDFDSTAGRRYRLETSTSLEEGGWTEVPGALLTAQGAASTLRGDFTPDEPRRFWRIVERP